MIIAGRSLLQYLAVTRCSLFTCRALRSSGSTGSTRSTRHMETSVLPFFAQGEIVKGFGRGSRELGFPTANFPDDVTSSIPGSLMCGIYCGWANVDNGEVYKMVMSIGYNPFYKNMIKTMETYIMHAFDKDLHGSLLKVCVLCHLRPELNFSSLDELKDAIKNDVREADLLLEKPENRVYRSHDYFSNKS